MQRVRANSSSRRFAFGIKGPSARVFAKASASRARTLSLKKFPNRIRYVQ